MKMLSGPPFDRLSSARRWAVLVCLLLVTITAAAQTFHAHPDELSTTAKHCAVCQLAHAPAQRTSTVHVTFGLARTLAFILSGDPNPQSQVSPFSLFSRPPPLG
jgi:hypothetical protein